MNNLKKHITLITFLFVTVLTNAQQKVDFVTNGNLRTVFELAKAQHKKVFLEVYAPDCHLCQALEPSFANAKVVKYYNDNFISYRLNMYEVETQAFLQKQKVMLSKTPALLFYSEDVKIIYQVTLTEQRLTADVLLEEAKNALTK